MRPLSMPGFLSGFASIAGESGFRVPDSRSHPLLSAITLRLHCPEIT
jgi:hypothetical protein